MRKQHFTFPFSVTLFWLCSELQREPLRLNLIEGRGWTVLCIMVFYLSSDSLPSPLSPSSST